MKGIPNPFLIPIVIGKITVIAVASDPSGIYKVEFWWRGELEETLYAPPWIWVCEVRSFFPELVVLNVTAYDNVKNKASAEMLILKWL